MPKQILEKEVKLGGRGIINNVNSELIGDGALTESFNFITFPDREELAGGRILLGAEETTTGSVLGFFVGSKADGTEIMLRKINTKLQYFDTATELWVNIKTDLIDGEPLYFDDSNTPAGRQIWMCGQDGLFKLYPSSPLSLVNLTHPTKNYKGKILIDKSRMVCWGMKEDPTGLRFSKVDKDSNYTSITAQAITDTAIGKKHYTGSVSPAQCFGLVFKDGTAQTLTDDKNGKLIGDGTGTIDYATGAYVLDFNANTGTPVTVDYLWENPLIGGLADFTYSASRLAGEGNVQRQDSTGSKSKNVLNFNNKFFTLQNEGSWVVSIDPDDVKWNNDIYRTSIGTPTTESSVITADGIIFLDTIDTTNPRLRLLGLDQYNENVIPYDLTDVVTVKGIKLGFKLSDYDFSECVMFRYYQFILISCKKENAKNDVIIVYNTKQKTYNVLGYGANWFATYNDKLVIGDSASPNVFEILSGYDDLDYEMTGILKYGKDLVKTSQLKKVKRFKLSGLIDPDQNFKIYASFDNGDFEFIGYVTGQGSYVDRTKSYMIGSQKIGEDIIGLGKASEAYYFQTQVKIHTPKFKHIQIAYEPTGIGYLALFNHIFSDVRLKGNKLPKKYKKAQGAGIGSESLGSNFEVQ